MGRHLSQRLLQRWSQLQALHIHLGDLLALGRQLRVIGPDQHVVRVPQLQRKQRRGESSPAAEGPHWRHQPLPSTRAYSSPGHPPPAQRRDPAVRGTPPVGGKYLLAPQVDHFPQELEQLSLVRAQPRPVGARRGHEEDHQVVGRRRHGATGPAERVKSGRGRGGRRGSEGLRGGREEARNFPRRRRSRSRRVPPPAAPLPEDTARGRRGAPGAGGGRSHAGCTPRKGAMAAGFSARGRSPTCPRPAPRGAGSTHLAPPAHWPRRAGTWQARGGGGWPSGGPWLRGGGRESRPGPPRASEGS